MIRADGRVIGRSTFIWVVLILVLNYAAIAKSPASISTPLHPAADHRVENRRLVAVNDPASPPGEQNLKTESAPAPISEDAARPTNEQAPDVDATVEAPTPEAEAAASDIPSTQSTEQSPEAEAAAADDYAPPAEEQGHVTVGASAEGVPAGVAKKSISKLIFSNIETTFLLTSGVRKDDFQWSIAGNAAGANPNVLSELTWSDVDSYEVSLSNRTIFNRMVYLRGDVNYAFIQSGRIQDSDYDSDNRGDEYSRSISDSSGDQIWSASLAAGYPFFFKQERLMVAPLLGYAYDVQNFRITDGLQVVTTPGRDLPGLGPLSNLNSTYRTTWQGPWIGFDLRYRSSGDSSAGKRPMEFGLSVEYHDVEYEAEANWNLRSDFQHPVSFEHFADGHGIAISAEWLIGLTAQWDFVFQTTYQHWTTGNGLDQVYNSDGTIDQARLNEVEWSNHSFMVGASFHF